MRCYNQLDRWSLRKADRVVTVCGAFARDLASIGVPENRIIVRHNSVKPFVPADPAKIDELRAGIPANTAILLVIGRLSREKGHAEFLDALALLRAKTTIPFHAILVGEGPEQQRIEAARNRLGLENIVTMVGLQHDVRPYYGVATVVVMPSHSEGSPNVLLESMAAGVPVVATSVGGVPEIAKDVETALLVESRNPAALASAVERMIGDPSLRQRLAANAKRLAEEQYSPDAHRRALVRIYCDVLGEA